ncbi:hypothetical protein MW290_24765 [Aquincola tertiaricarbonis]|uniref:Uncharacterized protein n=1 Tax=Aquincola tertiaricarbonis TaxID=391953 RepID=A0ABY4SAM0_AQUTE|nr:hypothetical protein [Aquincola tertiaricarbonis]URI08793.1 hypothetical protein MW290_24765 [Aquincola tertiaricarbonis]
MSDLMAERAALLRQVAELQAEVARLQAAMAVPDDVPDHDWGSLDGAVAWHLIDRHAEGWADIGRQMDLWLAARSAAAVAELQAQVEALRADAERYRWLRRWKGQEHEPPFTVCHEVDGTLWGGDLDAAIDAARKEG